MGGAVVEEDEIRGAWLLALGLGWDCGERGEKRNVLFWGLPSSWDGV